MLLFLHVQKIDHRPAGLTKNVWRGNGFTRRATRLGTVTWFVGLLA